MKPRPPPPALRACWRLGLLLLLGGAGVPSGRATAPALSLSRAVAGDGGEAPGLNAGDYVRVTFDAPTNARPVHGGVFFSADVGALIATWASPTVLVLTLVGAGAGGAAEAATALGVIEVFVTTTAGVTSADGSSAPVAASVVVVGTWGAAVGAIAGGGAVDPQRLSTLGGELLVLSLSPPLVGDPSLFVVTGSYGDESSGALVARGCAAAAGGVVTCVTAPGAGTGHAWTLVINGAPLPTSRGATTSYAPPVLVAVSLQPSVAPGGAIGGGGVALLVGAGFGPGSPPAVVSFHDARSVWPRYLARGCGVVEEDAAVACEVPPASGGGWLFSVSVGLQSTASEAEEEGMDASVAGGAPRVTVVLGGPLSTTRPSPVRIFGAEFGPARGRDDALLVQASPNDGLDVFNATNCSVVVGGGQIACLSSPGYGTRLKWRVVIGGVSSNRFQSNVSYGPPTIASVTPDVVPTSGGVITVRGAGFACGDDAAATVVHVGGVPAAAAARGGGGAPTPDCGARVVIVAEGVGTGVPVVVYVAGVASNALSFSYGAPALTGAAPYGVAGAPRPEVEVFGRNLGALRGAAAVAVGGVPCVVRAANHTWLVCTAATALPSGGATVTVTVGGQAAAPLLGAFDAASGSLLPVVSGSAVVRSARGRGAPVTGGGLLAIAVQRLAPTPPMARVLLTTPRPWGADGGDAADCAAAGAVLAAASGGPTVASGGPTVAWAFCTRLGWNATTALCALPPSRASLVHLSLVSVLAPGACALAPGGRLELRYDPPTVAYARPAALATCGGGRLELTGAGFTDDATVTVGGASCGRVAVGGDGRSLGCTYPPGSGARVALLVASDAYPAGSPGTAGVVVVDYAPPTITRVVPAAVPPSTGGVVCVLGRNLWCGATPPPSSTLAVYFGGVGVPVLNATGGAEVCVAVPPGTGGGASVAVQLAGQTAFVAGAFG